MAYSTTSTVVCPPPRARQYRQRGRTRRRGDDIRIDLIIEGTRNGGELYDNPVAAQLAGLLPLELEFADFNDVEKVAPLGRTLSLSGVPDADEPRAGEIGYNAPGRNLVLYYDSPGRWPGLVRVGRFDYAVDELRTLPDGVRIRIEIES